jgi:hypothetical protein
MQHQDLIGEKAQQCVWNAYHSLVAALELPCDPAKETLWFEGAGIEVVSPTSVISVYIQLIFLQSAALKAAQKHREVYIPRLLIAAKQELIGTDLAKARKELIRSDAPGVTEDKWYVSRNNGRCLTPSPREIEITGTEWWIPLRPQKAMSGEVAGKGKGRATEAEIEADNTVEWRVRKKRKCIEWKHEGAGKDIKETQGGSSGEDESVEDDEESLLFHPVSITFHPLWHIMINYPALSPLCAK